MDESSTSTNETAGTDKAVSTGRRAAPDGAPRHPLIDLSRDPTPGRPGHAKPDED